MIKACKSVVVSLMFCHLLSACSGAPVKSAAHLSPETHPHSSLKKWRRLWTQKLDGFISDIGISKNGKALLVATLPDREAENTPQKPLLIRLDASGTTLWSTPFPFGVRTLTLSDDGSLALVSTYDDHLTAFDSTGKELWSLEVTCRPSILSSVKKIICYHDEDAESQIGFDVFSFDGKKILSQPLAPNRGDALVFKVASDERHVGLGLTRGQLQFFSSDFKPSWEYKTKGEIVDLAIGPTAAAVLFDRAKKKSPDYEQRLVVTDFKGKPTLDFALALRMEQLEMSADGSGFYLYGNTERGQRLSFHSLTAKKPQDAVWTHAAESFANYSSTMRVSESLVTVGFDDIEDPYRHSHLRIFSQAGQLQWDIPLLTPEGAFLYVHDLSEKAGLIVTGLDDGTLGLYRLETP